MGATTGGRYAEISDSPTEPVARAGAGELDSTDAPSSWTVPIRHAADVVVIVFAATVLTLVCGSTIRYERFALFNVAVVAAAVYAGVPGGLFATIAGILIVGYRWLPPHDSLGMNDPPAIFAIVAFSVVSLAVTALAGGFKARAGQLKASHDAAVASRERSRLLAEVGRVLSSSLDYEVTVAAVARLAVPGLADGCAVDLVVDGHIERLAAAHADPAKERWARALEMRFRSPPDQEMGVPAVIRTGEPHFIPVVTEAILEEAAQSPEQLAAMHSVGIYSAMIVPLTTRGLVLGALSLISSRPDRHFDETDFLIAQSLGRRSAVAIDNARLYRAARAANESKSNFLATMSHELRTPLTAIIGFDELLADGVSGPVSEGQKEPLQRIKASAMHLLSLIEEILLLVRLDAGDESVHVEPVSARGVVGEVLASMSPAAAQGGLTLRVEPIDAGIVVRTDGKKLQQILVSLVSNAVKFTKRGEIVIRAFTRDDRVVFEVQDSGVGIGGDSLEHIFDPFWQVEQTKTRRSGGSGLGLTVARRLAQLLGGDLSADSTPAVGSTFRVALPTLAAQRA